METQQVTSRGGIGMAQEGTVQDTAVVADQPEGPVPESRYTTLMRQSAQLGQTAMKRVGGVKEFLNKEVPLPSAAQIWQNLPIGSKGLDVTEGKRKLDIDELRKIVQQSHQVLADVQTAFPITLFPDRVCLDRTVITITKRTFFWSANVISIRIEDILNVSSNVGPLFGSLTIASRVMSSVDHYEINFFWRNDAIEMKNIIQGYLVAKHSGMDTEHLSTEELVGMLRELGDGSPTKT